MCLSLLPFIPGFANSRVATIHVRRWLDFPETMAMETRLGFKVFQTDDVKGTKLMLAPQNETPARAYLTAAGLTVL